MFSYRFQGLKHALKKIFLKCIRPLEILEYVASATFHAIRSLNT